MQVISGALYGLWSGLWISWLATSVGQSLAFLLGRWVLRLDSGWSGLALGQEGCRGSVRVVLYDEVRERRKCRDKVLHSSSLADVGMVEKPALASHIIRFLTPRLGSGSLNSPAGPPPSSLGPPRYLFRAPVKAYLHSTWPSFPVIDAAIKQSGWKLVCLLRLSPVLPYNVLNYALAITPVSFLVRA